MLEAQLVSFPEDPQAMELNISATGKLLDTIRDEAAHPRSVISRELWFKDDGAFDLSAGPPLAAIADPESWGNSYMVGLRPDGVGQVVMLQREKGGVVGRVVITLYDGAPTRLLGERRVWDPELGLSCRESIDGQLASPDLLDQLGVSLSKAFDAKRARLYDDKPGRLRTLASALLGITGRFRRDATLPPAIEK